MSLTCEWFVLCERVINDSESNNLTLVTCLEQVNARRFPSQHHGFACAARYRWTGSPSETDTAVRYALWRLSEQDAPEVIAELEGVWEPNTRRGRLVIHFRTLRLTRPEVLRFRLDHRVGEGEWVEGPTCWLDVVRAE